MYGFQPIRKSRVTCGNTFQLEQRAFQRVMVTSVLEVWPSLVEGA